MNITSEQIVAKLKQVEEFEAKYGENTTSRAWRKWCTDEQYRNREEAFRNSVANSIKNSNKDYRYGERI
jgi:hypothetical protein